jgi:hypothetical protein
MVLMGLYLGGEGGRRGGEGGGRQQLSSQWQPQAINVPLGGRSQRGVPPWSLTCSGWGTPGMPGGRSGGAGARGARGAGRVRPARSPCPAGAGPACSPGSCCAGATPRLPVPPPATPHLVHLQQQRLHHVVADHLKVGLANKVRDVLLAAREKVVHADHLVAAVDKVLTQVAADEARAAGDEHAVALRRRGGARGEGRRAAPKDWHPCGSAALARPRQRAAAPAAWPPLPRRSGSSCCGGHAAPAPRRRRAPAVGAAAAPLPPPYCSGARRARAPRSARRLRPPRRPARAAAAPRAPRHAVWS